MKIEHVAWNVRKPLDVARWYVDHLGFTVQRRTVDSPWAHFLADDSGTVMIEIYGNPDVPAPEYAAMDPLTLHLALVSSDVETDIKRLQAAGATLIGAVTRAPNGDTLAMLRDPWGFCIQLVNRATPMIGSDR